MDDDPDNCHAQAGLSQSARDSLKEPWDQDLG